MGFQLEFIALERKKKIHFELQRDGIAFLFYASFKVCWFCVTFECDIETHKFLRFGEREKNSLRQLFQQKLFLCFEFAASSFLRLYSHKENVDFHNEPIILNFFVCVAKQIRNINEGCTPVCQC